MKGTLVEQVFDRKTLDTPALIKRAIEGYTFLDYATVDSYTDGIVDVVINRLGKAVKLTGIEVINSGSGGLVIKHTLTKGDTVCLISSKTYINSLDNIKVKKTGIPAYDIATIKAIPIATEAIDTLTVNSDGSFLFECEGMSIEWTGTILKINGDNPIELNGSGKFFVTHTELTTALNTFMQALNAHIHPTPNGPSSAPTVPMSLDISASKAEKVVTS